MLAGTNVALASDDETKPAATETHSYYSKLADGSAEAEFGKGDYVFNAVRISGSVIGKEMIFTAKDLEELALDPDKNLGDKHIYSYRNSGGFYSSNVPSGIRLYDFLITECGMADNLADDVPVSYYSIDGYSKTIKLADLRYDKYSYFVDAENEVPEFVGLPVMLSFGMGGKPMLGPTGDQSVNYMFSEAEGYDPVAGNSGGPIKITMGQKKVTDFNAQKNGKAIARIIIGDDINYCLHTGDDAEKDALCVSIYDNEDLLNKVDYTVGDLESFVMSANANRRSNFYDDGNFYEGVNIWTLLSGLDLPSFEGTVTFLFADSTEETLDLNYLRNTSESFENYVATKDKLRITCVRPIIAYAVNGEPIEDAALLTLLPKNGTDKFALTAKECREIRLNVGVPEDIHSGDILGVYGDRQISVQGQGMKAPCTKSVNELEAMASVIQTVADGENSYRGLNLYKLLRALKTTVDAKTVTVGNADGQFVNFELGELTDADSPILIFSKNGKALVPDEESDGFDGTVQNAGGPVALMYKGTDGKTEILTGVTEISVSIADGQWTHSQGVYAQYGDSVTLRICGTQAKKDVTYKLSDIEAMEEGTIRDSFDSSSGTFGFQGISLKYLIDFNLKAKVKKPSKITVIGDGDFTLELNYALLEKQIESFYQPGEVRDVIIAYGINGNPMVKIGVEGYSAEALNGDGPMRLIVENTISSWVKGVHTIILGEEKAPAMSGGGGGGSTADSGASDAPAVVPGDTTETGAEESVVTFKDAENHWAKNAIAYVVKNGLFNGTSKDTFSPDKIMTRAMVMIVLARMDGQNTDGGSVWYERGVAWAKEKGISDGTNPEGSVTREQLAVMLYRYAGEPAMDKMDSLSSFSDRSKASGYAEQALQWAVKNGIMGGNSDSRFPAVPAVLPEIKNVERRNAFHIVFMKVRLNCKTYVYTIP